MKNWARLVVTFLVAALIMGLVWLLLVFQLEIRTESWAPFFCKGDRILVSRVSYGLRAPFSEAFGLHRVGYGLPQKGELMVFNSPLDVERPISQKSLCIGRCSALPGDTVWLEWSASEAANDSLGPQLYPYIVPCKGKTIEVRPWNATLLANMLRLHEGRNVCPDCDSVLVVDGRRLRSVRFDQDYVCVGDLVSGSHDEFEVFGFVPHSHLVGRVLGLSISHNPAEPFYKGYRYERFFRAVE